MEVARVEDVEVFLELRDHEREHVAGLVAGEELAELLGAPHLVLALDDRAFVHADADRDLPLLAGVDHLVDLLAVVDVAGVQADLVHARLDRLERPLEVEVDIGHDRDGDLVEDLLERLRVLPLGDRHADHMGARLGVALDLGDARVDVVRVAGGHGLDGDGGVAADADSADAVVAEGDLTGLAAWGHSRQV